MNDWILKIFNCDCGVWQVFSIDTRNACEAKVAEIGRTIERVDERRRVIYADKPHGPYRAPSAVTSHDLPAAQC